MKLKIPTNMVFYISVALAVLGLIGTIAPSVPFLGTYAFIILLVAFVLLAVGVTVPGL